MLVNVKLDVSWYKTITFQGCSLHWSYSILMAQLKQSWQYWHSCIIGEFGENPFELQRPAESTEEYDICEVFTSFCLSFTMMLYVKIYCEAYTNKEYICLRGNIAQLYFILGRAPTFKFSQFT